MRWHVRYLPLKLLRKGLSGRDDAALFNQRCDFWACKTLHELMARGRRASESRTTNIAFVVSNVIALHSRMGWLADEDHTLPAAQTL